MSYYEGHDGEDAGWVHESDRPNLDRCRDQLAEIIVAVYRTGDIQSLEDSLEELTNEFELEIPKTTTVLEKSASIKTSDMLGEWLQFNQSHNENLLKITTNYGEPL